MAQDADQLARFFADVSVELHGVYRTSLEAGRFYRGHVETPTSKCGFIVPLAGEADFIFDGQERHRLAPGNLLIGGAGRRLEIAVGTSGFQYGLVHDLPAGMTGDSELARRVREAAVLETRLDADLLRLLELPLQLAVVPDSLARLQRKTLFYRLLVGAFRSERSIRNKESSASITDAIRHIHTF